MGDLLGGTPAATTRVLGAFFFGLALGGALATPIVARVRRPWRAVALLECGIAVLSVPALAIPWWAPVLWRRLDPSWLATGGVMLPLLLLATLVEPPAVLMGMTLPVLGRAALIGDRTLCREGNRLYAMNTAGGVIGLIGTTALTLGGLGAAATMAAVMTVNLTVACVALLVDRGVGAVAPEIEPATRAGAAPWGPVAMAFASGLGIL